MAFISLCVCFCGSVEQIKSRSDLRDQFRSTLAGFGESYIFGQMCVRAPTVPALLLLRLCVLSFVFSLPTNYAANIICLFIKMKHLFYLPRLIFWAETLTVEFMTN